MSRNCPSSDHLQLFLDETQFVSNRAVISEHINQCSRCQNVLEELTAAVWIEPVHDHPAATSTSATTSTVALNELMERMIRKSSNECPPRSNEETLQFPGPADATAPLGRLREYRILNRIAAGSQGILFRAFDESLQRHVAIKVLRPGFPQTPTQQSRFEREARLAAALNDERIVRVYQIGHQPEFPPFIVMEFVEGQSLRQQLEQRRPRFEEIARWVRDAALGLATAHQAGLIHRDIKPSNLLLDSATGLTRLTDFGLAIEQTDANRLTQDGVLAGTPAYMSPEQISCPDEVDFRSDIYSLGVVMYELLAGEVPFRGTLRMTLLQVAHDEPRSPRRLNDQIPRDLETLCLKAMARDRHTRFGSAAELASELARWQQGVPILSRPTGRIERVWRWCCRRPALATLSGLVFGLVISLIAVMSYSTWRLSQSAQIAKRHAAAATSQRDAAMETLSQLVFELQEQFEQDEVDVDDLQKNSLQIALDGLARLNRLADQEQLPGRLTAEAFRRMGDVLMRVEQIEQSRECLIRAEGSFRMLQNQPGERAAALSGLIETLWSRHDLELDAEEAGSLLKWLESATAAARSLFAEFPSDNSRLLLGKALFHEAKSHFDETEGGQPMRAFLSELVEVQGLLQPQLESDSPLQLEFCSLWLETKGLLAQYHADVGEIRQAIEQLTQALNRFENWNFEFSFSNPIWKLELILRFRVRELQLAQDDQAGAENQLRIVKQRLDRLETTVTSNSSDFLTVLEGLQELTAYLDEENDFEGVLFFVNKRLDFIEARLIEIPADEVALLARAYSWKELADASSWLDAPVTKVRQAFGKSIEQYRELSLRASFDEEHWFDYCNVLLSAAEYEHEIEANGLDDLLAELKSVRKELLNRFPTFSPQWLAQIESRLADLTTEEQ